MNIQQKKDFLINTAYWALIIAAVYLGLEYLLPISMPFVFGILIAWLVVTVTNKIHCRNRVIRILLSVIIYGIIGLLVVLLGIQGVNGISGLIEWLPEVYEMKLLPFVTQIYTWFESTIRVLDPALISALNVLLDSVVSSLKSLIATLSSYAVEFVTALATGIPNLILSLLAMIFSTVFVVSDYERISSFAAEHTPDKVKKILTNIRIYLTDTLFVVIRSYVLIMLLTFTELSILFSLFGIENAIVKATIIAILDIMPILGTGGIMIPWAVISLVVGHTVLGFELLLIYVIVTVVRNYVEPKIVGTQLDLHPIITLISMFIGLRLFGFWGLFGLPVGVSFLWKQRKQ